jgi:hypothetical protein
LSPTHCTQAPLQAAEHEVSERWVWRLCSHERLFSARLRNRVRVLVAAWSGSAIHDDLVQRAFNPRPLGHRTAIIDILNRGP